MEITITLDGNVIPRLARLKSGPNYTLLWLLTGVCPGHLFPPLIVSTYQLLLLPLFISSFYRWRKLKSKSKPELLCFYFRSLCDWSWKLAPLFQPIRFKTNRPRLGRPRFPALQVVGLFILQVLTSSSDFPYYDWYWFTIDCFGFYFTTINRKALQPHPAGSIPRKRTAKITYNDHLRQGPFIQIRILPDLHSLPQSQPPSVQAPR